MNCRVTHLYLPHDTEEKLYRPGPPCFPFCQTLDEKILKSAQDFSLDTVLGKAFTRKRSLAWSKGVSLRRTLGHVNPLGRAFDTGSSPIHVLIQPICEEGKPPVGVLVAWNIRDREDAEHRWFTAWDRGIHQHAAEHLVGALEQQRKSREQQWMLFIGTVRTNLVHLVTKRMRTLKRRHSALHASGCMPQVSEVHFIAC